MLTLQYKKVSQSITSVGHLFHHDIIVNVTLDSRAVHRIEEEKNAYFLRLHVGVVSIKLVHVVVHSMH